MLYFTVLKDSKPKVLLHSNRPMIILQNSKSLTMQKKLKFSSKRSQVWRAPVAVLKMILGSLTGKNIKPKKFTNNSL